MAMRSSYYVSGNLKGTANSMSDSTNRIDFA